MDTAPSGAVFQSLDVPFGEIHHMDVVAHPGAVDGWVIVTKDREAVAPADGDLGQNGIRLLGMPWGSSPECRTRGRRRG